MSALWVAVMLCPAAQKQQSGQHPVVFLASRCPIKYYDMRPAVCKGSAYIQQQQPHLLSGKIYLAVYISKTCTCCMRGCCSAGGLQDRPRKL